jgi:alpha-1,3-rhamnosyl/mannosyltransferase
MTLLEGRTGGSAVYAAALSRALAQRSDVDIEIVSSAGGGGLGTARWLASGAGRRASEIGADVFHSPAFIAPLRPTVPLIITIHDLSLGRMPGGHPLEWRLFYHLLLPRLVRRAAALLTHTESTRKDIIETFGVPADRVFAIPSGIDRRFSAVSPPDRRDPTAAPRILFPGPPIGRKNLDLALRVLAAAAKGGPVRRARLEITGATADEFPAYRDRIRETGLGDRVRWLGRIPDPELPAVYAGADLLIYPSFLEGFGFPPLEAMAAGTPVIASNASCLPEVLGDAALLVDPTDDDGWSAAIQSVLGDQKLRLRLVEAGRKRALTYTWERCAEMVAGVYRQVAGGD